MWLTHIEFVYLHIIKRKMKKKIQTFNFIVGFLIGLCVTYLIIGTPFPDNTLELITIFLISLFMLGLNVQYLNQPDKFKKQNKNIFSGWFKSNTQINNKK